MKMRIAADKIGGTRVQVGEVAAPAAADPDLLADFFGAFKYQDYATALSGLNRAEQSRSAATDDNYVLFYSYRTQTAALKPLLSEIIISLLGPTSEEAPKFGSNETRVRSRYRPRIEFLGWAPSS